MVCFRMEVVAIEHENTILELKEKNQKLKKKLESAEETSADRAEEVKNLTVRLAVRVFAVFYAIRHVDQ